MPNKEDLQLFKIITASGKKKLYESKRQFDQNWERHVDRRRRWVYTSVRKDVVPPVTAYKLTVSRDGTFSWKKIKENK